MSYVLVGIGCFMAGGLFATLVMAMLALQEDDRYPLDDIGAEEDKTE